MRHLLAVAVALAFTGCGDTTQPQPPAQTAAKLARSAGELIARG
jgi:hypothetical protein